MRLVTTHDMGVAQELCDHIGIIKEGTLVACKRTEDLIAFFSDYTFVFTLDRAPESRDVSAIEGVESVKIDEADGRAEVTVQVASNAAVRSEALYRLTDYFRSKGHQLAAVTQRKQTLEDVFLKLTSET